MATATESNVLEAQPRNSGQQERRAPRARGRQDSRRAVRRGQGCTVGERSIRGRWRAFCTPQTGHNTIFDLALEGGERTKAMIVDWQYEPIKGALLHIDLKRIAMDKKLTVSVPIVLKGEAAGVKQQGGILEQILREVEIECLPATFRAPSKPMSASWCSAKCFACPICRTATR